MLLNPAGMAIPELLERLLTTPGPSGAEAATATVWREAAEAFAAVGADVMGSSHARVEGTAGGPLLAIVGHIDEIGLVVTHVSDDGYLAFRPVGGYNPEVLRAQRVSVLSKRGPIPGVLGRSWVKPPKPGEPPPRAELDDLHIDIGARDGAEARELVRVGDLAVITGDPVELPNRRLVSRALDDRLGVYVALEAARLVAEAGGAAGDVVAVAAVQEEVGDFGGARTSAFALEPDVAIVVDVTSATDVPGGDPKLAGERKLGGGPAIDRGSTINPRVFELLCEAAESEGIPFTIEISTGTTYTDADAVHLSRAGVPTGLISIPTRYLHSPTETVALDDVEAAARVIAAFARRLEPGMSFAR